MIRAGSRTIVAEARARRWRTTAVRAVSLCVVIGCFVEGGESAAVAQWSIQPAQHFQLWEIVN